MTYGRGAGVVVTTGMATALGRIADLFQAHPAGLTPLQRPLSTLGKRAGGCRWRTTRSTAEAASPLVPPSPASALGALVARGRLRDLRDSLLRSYFAS